MEKSNKSCVMQIPQVFDFNILIVEVCSQTELSRQMSKQVFHSVYFRRCIGYEGIFFFKMVKITYRV